MNTPLCAKLCHKCNENYVGRLCPKCTPKAEFLRLNPAIGKFPPVVIETMLSVQPEKPARSLSAPKGVRQRKAMNKTEARMAQLLEAQKRNGEIESYAYEAITLRLGADCRFTPDFFVVVGYGEGTEKRLRFVESKGGHIWEDSKIKFRVAKEMFPWAEWEMWQWKNKTWTRLY